jgi:hypothetical protein
MTSDYTPASPKHGHYYYWCTNCATVTHVETTEHDAGDDSRNVQMLPPDAPPCPLCEHQTEDYDILAAHSETPLNDGSWAAFESWRLSRIR